MNDTTDQNYRRHLNFVEKGGGDLGPTGNDKDIGFFLHLGYVVDCKTGSWLGFSYIKIWNRRFDKPDKHRYGYKQLPIEEKESFRWVECGEESKKYLGAADHVTIVGDRERDIYSEFVRAPDHKTDLLIRSCRDRKINEGKSALLYGEIASSPCNGTYLLDVKKHGTRKARLAIMEVRFQKVKIMQLGNHVDKTLPGFIEVSVV